MRVRGRFAITLAAATVIATLGFTTPPATAQISPSQPPQQPQLPADSLRLGGSQSIVWSDANTSIIELKGPVDITLDHAHLTADDAVVWLSPQPALLDEQRVQIALIGAAKLTQDGIVRTERNLLVTAVVTGSIRLNADRVARDDHGSELYVTATAIRAGQTISTAPSRPSDVVPQRRWSETTTTRPATTAPTAPLAVRPKQSLDFDVENFKRETTSDGSLAAVLTGGVTLRYHDPKGNLIEFLANSAVLFTDLKSLKGIEGARDQKRLIADHVKGAYFEGDVQVYTAPSDAAANVLSMRAERVYYEFDSDRAILTDVVFHTVDVRKNIPIFMRAQTVRQLSQGEFKTENVELSTSGFATPTYSLAAQKAYVRTEASGDPDLGSRVTVGADNAFFKAFGIPVFYLPAAGGTMTARGMPLRAISFDQSHDFGFGVRTQWGLFETLGQPPPKDLDASFRADYYSERGPAGGLDARYAGGFITDETRDAWNFLGDLHAYFVDDHGTDTLDGERGEVKPPDSFRGRAYLEHQHFFPDDWQVQLRLGWVSDANFLSEWFPDEFRDNLPINESIYLKHQKDNEVFTLLAEWQPNDVVTSADFVQEQREIQRLPEVGYHRIGESFADDRLTFFSDNTAAGLSFATSGATLAQQGYFPGLSPGLPSFAYTGDPNDTTWRGDFRQEIDWPINAGPIKMVPYAFARYTVYSQGVQPPAVPPTTRTIPAAVQTTSDQNRIMSGVGARFTTAFWKVDNSVESDLFDLHRLRHVIEPEINLFASAQTVDQTRLFIYDENVDAINDVQAAQLALRQRWQTKRGGPGRWRNVDVFTLDIYGNFFANQPAPVVRDPVDFRGLFFPTMPEASVARNSVNMDAQWRISDTMTVLADAYENLDSTKFATGSIGLAVQRDERLSYFVGTRYIADLNSNITTVQVQYQLTRKYTVQASQSFDFGQGQSVYYTFELDRKFDRFMAGIRFFYDQTTNDNGVSFTLVPYGLQRGIGTDHLNQQY